MDSRKLQNILFGVMISVAVIAILLVISTQIKITPLQVYQDKQFGFSLKYPTYWKAKERPGGKNGSTLVVFFPSYRPKGLKFLENVNITLFDLSRTPKLTNLRAFTVENIRQIQGVFGKYENVFESKDTRVAGIPAYRFGYVTSGQTMFSQTKMKYLYVWFLHGQYAYIFTYVGQRDRFNKSLEHFNRMLRTFRFKKK